MNASRAVSRRGVSRAADARAAAGGGDAARQSGGRRRSICRSRISSGGGAGGLPVKLRSQVEPKFVAFPDFDDYAFAAGDVTETKQEEGDTVFRLGNNVFADPDEYDDDEIAAASGDAVKPQRVNELGLALDASGGARATVKGVGRQRRAARSRRRARIPRSERRDADRRDTRRAVAVARRARHQDRSLGGVEGPAEVHRRRRSISPAGPPPTSRSAPTPSSARRIRIGAG